MIASARLPYFTPLSHHHARSFLSFLIKCTSVTAIFSLTMCKTFQQTEIYVLLDSSDSEVFIDMLIVVVLCAVASLWKVIVPPFKVVELSEKMGSRSSS